MSCSVSVLIPLSGVLKAGSRFGFQSTTGMITGAAMATLDIGCCAIDSLARISHQRG